MSHFGQNYQRFLAEEGVQSRKYIDRHFDVRRIRHFGKLLLSDLEYILPVGNPELDCFWYRTKYCFKKKARKPQG